MLEKEDVQQLLYSYREYFLYTLEMIDNYWDIFTPCVQKSFLWYSNQVLDIVSELDD